MSTRKQSDNTVKLFAGASLVIGIILSALGTITGIVDWPQERKIIFGGVLIVGLLSLEFVRWNRKRKRISPKKLPWLLDLIVDVQGELDSESKKVLRDEIILQILKLALVSIIVTIIVAAGINWSEISLGGVMNPPTFTPTPTQTSTNTSTATSTFPPSTATPEEQGIFYMFVLDASVTMTESFEAQTKWDAALRAVDSILVGLEDGANYGLVAIGGAPGIGSSNPCEEPSLLAVPFSTSKAEVGGRVGQLQPGGGGSLYRAFVLAVDELDRLPESTVRSLIYITGSEDACDDQDEWADLERFFRIRGDARLDIYSEIIIIDEKNGIRTQTIADRISNLSDKVNVQAPQTVFQLLQSNNTVVNNISNYVDITIASFPTNTPTNSPPTSTAIRTPTPQPGIATVTPSNTVLAPPTFTLTSSLTPSLTPSITPSPSPTLTPAPFVSLEFHGEYVPSGGTCIARIIVTVVNGPVSGIFHVWNASYGPEGDPYDPFPFAVGTSDYWVGLGGDQPAYYEHKVWLEYNNGTATTPPITGLACPNMPTATP